MSKEHQGCRKGIRTQLACTAERPTTTRASKTGARVQNGEKSVPRAHTRPVCFRAFVQYSLHQSLSSSLLPHVPAYYIHSNITARLRERASLRGCHSSKKEYGEREREYYAIVMGIASLPLPWRHPLGKKSLFIPRGIFCFFLHYSWYFLLFFEAYVTPRHHKGVYRCPF